MKRCLLGLFFASLALHAAGRDATFNKDVLPILQRNLEEVEPDAFGCDSSL